MMKASLKPNWKSGFSGFAAMTMLVIALAHAALLIPSNLNKSQPLDALAALGMELIFAVPALLYLIGFTWMRYVVSVQCFLLLPLWLLSPVVLHSIERTPLFWLVWTLSLMAILFSAFVNSVPPRIKR
ncbi:hypothetical protein WJU23_20305 [Prosthecobacter sp. SYSU 5D2]|uniref:hypothetical protein n=1 Tax=Prosthecobacter sp. SYSU 5D2 TaxID=3134134 RepID=UPI0031FED6B4